MRQPAWKRSLICNGAFIGAFIGAVALPAVTACTDAAPLGAGDVDPGAPGDPRDGREGEGEGEDLPVALTADLRVDTDRNGVIDAADDAREDVFDASGGAAFFANVDDDDGDGLRDSRDDKVTSVDDLDDLTTVELRAIAGLGDETVTLTAAPAAALDLVRVWRKEGDALTIVLDPNEASGTATLTDVAGGATLLVEALVPRTADWDGNLQLTLELTDGGDVLSTDTVALRVSPVIFPDNLQAPRTLFVMDLPSGGSNNAAFVNAMTEAMPADVEMYLLNRFTYNADRWVQDNMELGYQQRPSAAGPVEMKTAMQLQRGYGGGDLRDFVPSELVGAGQGYLFPGGDDTSHNYGGNLEVAPPVAGFPFGRMLFGGGTAGTLTGRQISDSMNDDQVAFLNAQEVQAPALELSSEWLAVGHIDEIFQFVPDLTPDDDGRDFHVVIASPALARDALLAVQARGNGALEVFTKRNTRYSVDEILAAENFQALNEAAQARIDSVQAELIAELGLEESDFLAVPVFYIDESGGLVSAFNPGIQNLVTVGDRLFVPDPEGPIEDGVDVWQEATRAALADTDLDVIFVDVFNSYHRLMGEAHCGTNVDRAPYDTAWWTE